MRKAVACASLLTVWMASRIIASDGVARQDHGQAPGESALTMPNETLPVGARLYVAPMPSGFETYVIAGLEQKKVPVVVVAIRDKADFELTGVSETDKAGWAKMLMLANDSTNETASIKIVNLKTGNVVFAYSVHKGSSFKGKQSAGEAVAKHINEKIRGHQQ